MLHCTFVLSRVLRVPLTNHSAKEIKTNEIADYFEYFTVRFSVVANSFGNLAFLILIIAKRKQTVFHTGLAWLWLWFKTELSHQKVQFKMFITEHGTLWNVIQDSYWNSWKPNAKQMWLILSEICSVNKFLKLSLR